jgi:hypothetical protein
MENMSANEDSLEALKSLAVASVKQSKNQVPTQ